MSEYKGIKGFQVQTRTEDPAPFAQALADNPYAGAWASGGNLNTARDTLGTSTFGTTTATVAFGGYSGPTGFVNLTENYNGTSWTEVNELNTAKRYIPGAGTYTSAISAGGATPPNTNSSEVELWDGTSWTETTDLNTAKSYGGGWGATNTAAIVTGGYPVPAVTVEQWNGSAWTEVAEYNTARLGQASFGTSYTSGLIAGGASPPRVAVAEQWNGSTWTEVNDLNEGRSYVAGSGLTTAGLAFGGSEPPPTGATEAWDGTSWTEVNDLGTARKDLGGAGASGTDGLAVGGDAPPKTAATEEWTFSGLQPTDAVNYSDSIIGDFYYNSTTGQFKNISDGISAGAWGSGGTMNTARYRMFGGFGPHSEGLVAGGQAPVKANCENYNGTSWTEVADIPSALSDSGMIGVYTAGVLAGGEGSPGDTNEALHWNGSAWTEATNMPISVERCSGSGVQTAGLIVGGRAPPGSASINTTLEYDGTNWTSGGNLPATYYNIAVQGPQTSALGAGGVGPPGSGSTLAYTYNGTAWTQVNSSNTGRYESGWATQGDGATRGLIFGGNDAPARPTTELYDGTSWTELNDLSTGRAAGGSFGSVNNAVFAGGSSPALSPTTTGVTEEWSASDTAIKTVTTS